MAIPEHLRVDFPNDAPELNDDAVKEEICEIGRRLYEKGYAAANDGNISVRVGEDMVLCSPTMICKGFMTPEDICGVDMQGNQIYGQRKRTSEILLHLSIMRNRDDVKSCVHCHPPHATAFGVAGEPIPQGVLPEVEVFLGETPFAPYETPGGQVFADTVLPFLKGTNHIVLKNHGTISFGPTCEEAYWKTEVLDSYCRILLLAKQMGPIDYLAERHTRELLDLKKQLGFDDPRFHYPDADLVGNTAFRGVYDGDGDNLYAPKAFNPPPSFGPISKPAGKTAGELPPTPPLKDDPLVTAIAEKVVEMMSKK